MTWSGLILTFTVCLTIVRGEECQAGKYRLTDGATCQEDCGQCLHNKTCNGKCYYGCRVNFEPPDCTTCKVGRWGDNCEKQCGKCEGWSGCNKATGDCGNCEVGRQPPSCKDKCNGTTYGPGCTKKCGQCRHKSPPCDPITGACPGTCPGKCPGACNSGYTGSACTTKCPKGAYGEACEYRCGHCLMKPCNHVTGRCVSDEGCESGYQGDKCDLDCSNNTYGMNCNETCDCPNDIKCDPRTGLCIISAMSLRMSGEMHNFWLTFKGGIAGSVVVFSILAAIFVIIFLIKRGRRRKNSLIKMHRIQKKLSDNVRLTGVDPQSENELQSELRSRLPGPVQGDSCDKYSDFPISDPTGDPQAAFGSTSRAPSTVQDTQRNNVTSIASVSSNYVTAVSTPGPTAYINLSSENQEIVHPYEGHAFSQTDRGQERRHSPVYANSSVTA